MIKKTILLMLGMFLLIMSSALAGFWSENRTACSTDPDDYLIYDLCDGTDFNSTWFDTRGLTSARKGICNITGSNSETTNTVNSTLMPVDGNYTIDIGFKTLSDEGPAILSFQNRHATAKTYGAPLFGAWGARTSYSSLYWVAPDYNDWDMNRVDQKWFNVSFYILNSTNVTLYNDSLYISTREKTYTGIDGNEHHIERGHFGMHVYANTHQTLYDYIVVYNGTDCPVAAPPNVPPVITFIYPNESYYYKDYDGWINFTTDEDANCTTNNTDWVLSTDYTNATAFFFNNSGYATLADGEYNINVSCWDASDENGTTTLTFGLDTINPTLITSLKKNNTVVADSLSFQLNYSDVHLIYGINITATDYFYSEDGIDLADYSFNGTITTLTNYTQGYHSMNTTYCDAHTTLAIDIYKYETDDVLKRLTFNFGKNYISIKPKEYLDFERVETQKETDRYSFNFVKKAGYKNHQKVYVVKSNHKISIIKNNEYQGWLVIYGLKKWMDFETEGNDVAIVKRISDYEVEVRTRGEHFSSVGDLNCITDSFKFAKINYTINYTASVTEQELTTFNLYINNTGVNITSFSAVLVRAGTTYALSYVNDSNYINFTTTISTPFTNASDYVKTFYFNVTLNDNSFSTNSYTQTVSQFYIDSCGNQTNTTTLNITFRDELTNELLNGSVLQGILELRKGTSAVYRNVTINESGESSYAFCIYPNDATLFAEGVFIYSKTNFETRTYYYFNKTLNNVTTYDTFYHLSSANNTDIKITTTDEKDNNLVGYYIDLLHWYPSENLYRVVEIARTDPDGQVLFHVVYDTVFYKLRFRRGNTILRETEKFQIHNTLLNYQLRVEPSYLEQYASLREISGGINWNNNTRTITFSWTDTGSAANYYCMDVDRFTGLAKIKKFSQCSTDRSGSIEYVIPDDEGRFIAYAYSKQPGSLTYKHPITQKEIHIGIRELILGGSGLLIAAMFLMMMAPIGYTLMGIKGIPLFTIFGLGAMALGGIITLGVTTFISLIITVVIMIWKVKG